MKELMGLEGKRILVLGGGLGMGEATSRLLSKMGANVAVVDLEISRAEKVAYEITENGGHASPFSFDALDDNAVVAGIAEIESSFGPLDGMSSIIGMASWSSLLDMDMETWDTDHQRNLRYFFLAAREVAKHLIKRGAPGAIVGVSSMDGQRCAPYHGAYGAAKAGLSNLIKTMTVEWAPHGIRTNLVAPGAIITPRVPDAGDKESFMTDKIPMRRRGTVDDIAKAITFLLSDMAPYITGQTLAVDGGFLAAYPLDLTPPASNTESGH